MTPTPTEASMTNTESITYRNHTAKFYDRQVERVVEDLRRLADEVEREARPRETPGVTGCPRYTAAASNAMHSLLWGFANLHADSLITSAGEADAAEVTS